MNQKELNNWIMYHEIHRLSHLGFSISKIARYLVVDRRTVGKYLKMTQEDYESFLLKAEERHKLLAPYEGFAKGKLTMYPDTTAAQLFDWLKEHHRDLPDVSPRTVYNFTMFVRQKYDIPVVSPTREYSAVEELPYGEQAQVDFGEYNMRTCTNKRQKVKFFVMVLSRSRMKYLWFLDKPFTSLTMCQAHENSFEFYRGVPKTIVYDQDRVMMVDENIGEIILTDTFKRYTQSRSFNLHFCRKSDPESKGKVENVVGYVKRNFLYNRVYHELETLNTQALAWLSRTANHLEHNYTKKSPHSEFVVEQKHLSPYVPLLIENKEKEPEYYVRKNNVITFKSNFYSVPFGTYQGGGTTVKVRQNGKTIEIYTATDDPLCVHMISQEKGKTIINTNHKRDTSQSLGKMIETTAVRFSKVDAAKRYLEKIRTRYPRYLRDQLQHINKTLDNNNYFSMQTVDQTLEFCVKNELYSALDFEKVIHVVSDNYDTIELPLEIKNIKGNASSDMIGETPQKSDLSDYETILKF